jgi:two-component system nitrate/nitrite response regulator NarL
MEPIAMEGLRGLMELNNGPRVVSTENALEGGAGAVRKLSPALLIVDRCFGAHTVMDWLRVLRAEHPATAAIVWGTPISDSEALRFVQAGASGVIRKTAPIAELLTCIRTVLSGDTWMENNRLPDAGGLNRTGRSALTSRESQVMELVERGMKNKEIGGALGIQTGTVKIHLKHIFEKTGIRGRYGLALSGLKQKHLAAMEMGRH